ALVSGALATTVHALCLAFAVPGLSVELKGLFVVMLGDGGFAGVDVQEPKSVEHPAVPIAVTDPTKQVEGLTEVFGGGLVSAQPGCRRRQGRTGCAPHRFDDRSPGTSSAPT